MPKPKYRLENESDEVFGLCNYVSKRITELRLKKDVSEYKMSLDLGQNRTYIQSISTQKSLPSLFAFFKICEYFEISPIEFFEPTLDEPELYANARKKLYNLYPDDVDSLVRIMERLPQRNKAESN